LRARKQPASKGQTNRGLLGDLVAAPVTGDIRTTLARPAGRRAAVRPAHHPILSPRLIEDHGEMKQAVGTVATRLENNGVAPSLIRTAFAALVDNALTHGGGKPVAAVYLSDEAVTVTSRDQGQAIARSADAKLELVRRIQFPAEDADPAPGAPAGLPWLARLLVSRCPDGTLLFMAGDGRLTFHRGVWACRQGDSIDGFAAVARLPLATDG
jgi:hypothetical protein